MIIQAPFGKIDNIEIDGSRGGRHGMIMRSAARSIAERVNAHNLAGDGFRVETGNNNFVCFDHTVSNFNQRGYATPSWDPDGLGHPDINGIDYLEVEAQGNRGSGILIKGQQHKVRGGQLSENGRYGVEIGEDSDIGFNTGTILDYPWLEGNTLGTVGFSKKAVRNLLTHPDVNEWAVEASPWGNMELVTTNDAIYMSKRNGWKTL